MIMSRIDATVEQVAVAVRRNNLANIYRDWISDWSASDVKSSARILASRPPSVVAGGRSTGISHHRRIT